MFFRKKVQDNRSIEERFWAWFQEQDLLHSDGKELLHRVGPKLKEFDESLVAEVGPPDQHPRELILSADGVREAIQSVESLADAAPALQGWKITRFRPPLDRYEEGFICFEGVDRRPEQLLFIATKDAVGVMINLWIYADWYNAPGNPDGALFVLLDKAIGEYNVMCKIGEIQVFPTTDAPEYALPWSELRSVIESN